MQNSGKKSAGGSPKASARRSAIHGAPPRPDLQLYRGVAARCWRLDHAQTGGCRFPSRPRLTGRAVAHRLGDRVLQKPDPCPCGNPRPAIRIQGRSAEVLRFPTEGGEEVAIPPLAVEIYHVPRVDLSQVVQTTPTNLRVRLRVATGAHSRHAWQRVNAESKHLLDRHELPQVTISGTVQGRQGQANFSGEGETRCSLPRDQRPV